jgi:hypothetical protein
MVASGQESDPGDDTSAPLEASRPESGPVSPRVASLALLAGELARLAAAGDHEGARILHETIGRLLAAPVRETAAPPERETGESGAPVVNLGDERRRRGTR